jgi:hypothetical protein
VAVGIIIDRHCVADGVEVTPCGISATRELSSEDEVVEFGPWIVAHSEHLASEESLSPPGTEMRLLGGGGWEFPEGQHFC